jgi:DNA polymerase-1
VQWAEALLDETAHSYALETLAHKYLGAGKATTTLVDLYGPEVVKHMREVHPAHMRVYALRDVALPLAILDRQVAALAAENLTELFDLESRLTPLLLDMRRRGVRVDLEKAAAANRFLAQKRDKHLLEMQRAAGFEVDPDSGPSVARACDHLGIPYTYTEKGNPSFTGDWMKLQAARDWIEELDDSRRFFLHLMEAKKYEKARNPFVSNYILGSHIEGRIHAEFHPLRRADNEGERGTVSGRFSSSHPNLQNIPSRDPELGPMLRSLFIPDDPETEEFFAADYSQMEFIGLLPNRRHLAPLGRWPILSVLLHSSSFCCLQRQTHQESS